MAHEAIKPEFSGAGQKWTLFWDMNSGGGKKITPYSFILINMNKYAAIAYFQERFGRDPENVTCECCGEDYRISTHNTLEDACGWHADQDGLLVDEFCSQRHVLVIENSKFFENCIKEEMS